MSDYILVIGSSNTDMVVKTAKFPQPGETVLGGTFTMNPGGKGANQAVAAARLGAKVRFIAKIGDDVFGRQTSEDLIRQGLDIQHICVSADYPSGIALITVNEEGENEIVVASGANMDLKPADLPDEAFENVGIVLVQLEIPLDTITYVVQRCTELNIRLVLNPAPAIKLPNELLKEIYLITPNETETQILTGIFPNDTDSLKAAARDLRERGVENVIITLGKRGVYLYNKSHNEIISAPKVKAIDTTAAGDTFSGALLVALVKGYGWVQACEFACSAAALSVTRVGAQSSAPYLHELNSE